MKPRHKKFALILTIVIGLSVSALFVLNAFKSNLVFFHPPSDVYAGKVPVNKTFRLGGMVEKGSVKKSKNSLRVDFIITDFKQSIAVSYRGILPDLFSEGQGVIAQGKLQDGKTFIADEVLAKHDENYMPPEVADILKNNKKTGSKPE